MSTATIYREACERFASAWDAMGQNLELLAATEDVLRSRNNGTEKA